MPSHFRQTAVLIIAMAACTSNALAGRSTQPFVAPGLWLIVTDTQGSMGQHTQLTQEQCWNAQGESGQNLIPMGGGRMAGTTGDVRNTPHQSIVHAHATIQMPGAGVTVQDITMVFTRGDSMLRKATMVGHGSMKSTSVVLNETFTQHGQWVSATCPSTLPPAQIHTLAAANIPALTALQHLAAQLKAQDPHPNGP